MQVSAPDFSPSPRLLAPLRVKRVEKAEGGGFNVVGTWKDAKRKRLRGLRKPLGEKAGEEGTELVSESVTALAVATEYSSQ